MNLDKTIAVVGISDEEAAHLRLLMRKCASALDCGWRWGDEKGADLLVVDLGSFAGQMARTRALASGVRCVIFSDESMGGPELILRRPLRGDNVVEVLNQAANVAVVAAQIGSHSLDFYTRELGEHGSDAAVFVAEPVAAVDGLDELLRHKPAELRVAQPWTPSAEPPLPPTSMEHDLPAIGTPPPRAAAVQSVAPRSYATRASMLADTAPHSLRACIEQELLSVPARFTLPGEVSLVLDPKHKVAHAAGGLAALAPYCRNSTRLCDWQPLTSGELAAVRATEAALPYARLIWLDVLLHSGGQLARHLDPGGTYRLTRWTEIDYEPGRYFRIASALLQPARLHDVAATSGAHMTDVFDLVNANDAIGAIEWQPRRRGGDAQPSSLLGRLLRPFG